MTISKTPGGRGNPVIQPEDGRATDRSQTNNGRPGNSGNSRDQLQTCSGETGKGTQRETPNNNNKEGKRGVALNKLVGVRERRPVSQPSGSGR